MDFKLFMNSVEENLSLIKTEEELRNWIRNYARSIPEEERGSFLEQIQIRKLRSHNEILQELTDWCEKVEEGEITLSCSGYEEYGESWWDRDWVTEYEDPMGIGAQLKRYYEEAEQFFQDEEWDRLREEGMEALRRMKRNMKIRDKAARMTAAAATHTGDSKTAAEALKEAFCSKPTAANYFRILTCGDGCGRDDMKSVLELAERVQREQRQQDNGAAGQRARYYWREPKETDVYCQTEQDRLGIRFLDGDCHTIWQECRKTKNTLGWTGKFISEGVPMLLAVLCENDFEGRAMQAMFSDIKHFIGYEKEYDEPEFTERFLQWKKQTVIPEDGKKEILTYLTKTIDARVEAIVGGGHRVSYCKAARLGAALGEVEESMGKRNGKEERVSKYLAEFPRYRAFKQEIKAYM